MQSPRGILCKKGIYKKVCNVYRKALVLEPLFNKVAGRRTAALSKKDSSTGAFPWILQNLQEQIF